MTWLSVGGLTGLQMNQGKTNQNKENNGKGVYAKKKKKKKSKCLPISDNFFPSEEANSLEQPSYL